MIATSGVSLAPAMLSAAVALLVATFAYRTQLNAWRRQDKRMVYAKFLESLDEYDRVKSRRKDGQHVSPLRQGEEELQSPEETRTASTISAERVILTAKSKKEISEAMKVLQLESKQIGRDLPRLEASARQAEEEMVAFRRHALTLSEVVLVGDRRTVDAASFLAGVIWDERRDKRALAETLFLLEAKRELGYLGFGSIRNRIVLREARSVLRLG
jgi:hypothetical protein